MIREPGTLAWRDEQAFELRCEPEGLRLPSGGSLRTSPGGEPEGETRAALRCEAVSAAPYVLALIGQVRRQLGEAPGFHVMSERGLRLTMYEDSAMMTGPSWALEWRPEL